MAGDLGSYITLVILTESRAYALKKELNSHDIFAKLERVKFSWSKQDTGVRVQVHQHDLPLALNVLESGMAPVSSETGLLDLEGLDDRLLIPVDFSESSMLACRMGFQLASRLNLRPVVLHAFTSPVFYPGVSASGDLADEFQQVEAEGEQIEIERLSKKEMIKFRKDVEKFQHDGTIVDIPFAVKLTEGVAEDVILEYTRNKKPSLVVMSTRGKERKEEELIGSVTAEVLDGCRVPIFTVPENYPFVNISDITRLIMFCNVDRHDIVTIDNLMRMFDFPNVEVTLVPVNERVETKKNNNLVAFRDYLSERYPVASFSLFTCREGEAYRKCLDSLIKDKDIQLIIVPNKKSNIFSRIFKPTIGHKFLFERDIPILAIPV